MTVSHDGGPARFDVLAALRPGVSLVEASAGTGKTWSIASLYVRLVVEEDLAVDRIVVLTFARAAAAELRGRVRQRLVAARAALGAAQSRGTVPDDVVLAHLIGGGQPFAQHPEIELAARARRVERALGELDAGGIATIHGFCLDAVRCHALSLGKDVGCRLSEDEHELVEEIVLDFLSRTHGALSAGGSLAQRAHADLHRQGLVALARVLLCRPDSRVLPDPVGDGEAFAVRLAAFRASWLKGGREDFRRAIYAAQDDGVFGTSQLTLGRKKGKPRDDYAPFAKAIRAMDNYLDSQAPAAVAAIADGAFSRANVRGRIEAGRSLPPGGPIDSVSDFIDGAGAAVTDPFRASFVSFLRTELPARRRVRRELGFSDVLSDLRDALRDPASGDGLLKGLRAGYDAALLDEFQDTDPVQWEIFRRTFRDAKDKHLILVGDPKQAIYGFRGADVRVYEDARGTTPAAQRSTLTTNHRSDGALVHALNTLYGGRGAVFEEDGIAFTTMAHAQRNPWRTLESRGSAPAPLRIRWFDAHLTDPSASSFALGKTQAAALVPGLVAADIAELLQSGMTRPAGEGGRQALTPGDVAVLVRTNRQAEAVQRALSRIGIAAVTPQAGSIFASEEAAWIEGWLAALLEGDEQAARGLALSPLGGFSVSMLHRALHESTESWARFCSGVVEARRLFDTVGLAAALRWTLDLPRPGPLGEEDSVLARLARAENGERVVTNLRHLEELLQGEQQRRAGGVPALLDYLRRQRESSDVASESAELRLESDRDAVRITTVHKSKGLEYPVVFVPYAWDGTVLRAAAPAVVFHARDASGAPTLDVIVDARTGKGRPGGEDHRRWAAEEALAENLRLLYVALTRAQHHVVLYAGPVESDRGASLGTSPLAVLLHGGQNAAAAPRSRAGIAAAETARLLATGARAHFREVVEDLADQARRSQPKGENGPIIDWSEASAAPRYGASLELPRGSSPGPALRIGPLPRSPLRTAFQRASYSSLVRDKHAEGASVASPAEEDNGLDDPADDPLASTIGTPTKAWSALPDVPLARFVRGPAAGVFVHGLLERIDFRTGHERTGPIRVAARTLGAGPEGRDLGTFARAEAALVGISDEDVDLLVAALPAVLSAPLGVDAGGIALADLAPEDRLDELGFDLSVARGQAYQRGAPVVLGRSLGAALGAPREDPPWPASYGRALRAGAAAFPDLAGFLTGSIDLVYRVRRGRSHRYYLADYKTNWLGEARLGSRPARSTVAHYERNALAGEMVKHHYFVQGQLYLLALHRYLRLRLGARYDYDEHLGGTVYLFLRGMSAAPAPGPTPGVFFDRPPRAVIEALDAVLGAIPS